MAEQEQTPDYSTFEKYQYGALAARFLNEKDMTNTQGALEVLAGGDGLNLGNEAIGFIRGTQASEKGIEIAASMYGARFAEERGKLSPANLAGWYSDVLSGLDEDYSARLTASLRGHTETWADIIKKVSKANHIMEGGEIGVNTPEQVAEARSVFEKYQSIGELMSILDKYKMESLRPKTIDVSRKKALSGIASKLPGVRAEEPTE